jgi:hypothetical protein
MCAPPRVPQWGRCSFALAARPISIETHRPRPSRFSKKRGTSLQRELGELEEELGALKKEKRQQFNIAFTSFGAVMSASAAAIYFSVKPRGKN